MEQSIKTYMVNTYPKDTLVNEIREGLTFSDLLLGLYNKTNIYDLIGVHDSIIREACFGELARRVNVDYNFIYNKWLNK